jgi:hypothetical protein
MGFNGVAILSATYQLLPALDELSVQFRLGATAALLGLVYYLVLQVGRHPLAQEARALEMTVPPDSPGNQREGSDDS